MRTIDRLLAAAELQIRVVLEPLRDDLDVLVAAVVAGTPDIDVGSVETVVRSTGATGGITWAFDGPTALNLLGVAVPPEFVHLALLFDPAACSWLEKVVFRLDSSSPRASWRHATLDEATRMLDGFAFGPAGVLRIRPVQVWPNVVQVELPGLDGAVPVVSSPDVEVAFPQLGELMERVRATVRARSLGR